MVVAWRLAWLVRLGRTHPDINAGALFTETEWKGAYILAKKKPPTEPPTLRQVIRQIAMLCGFLGRSMMASPVSKPSGSALHVSETLWKVQNICGCFNNQVRVLRNGMGWKGCPCTGLRREVGVRISVETGIGIYAIAVLAGALLFLPGGLGSTEAVMCVLLVAFGADSPAAVAITLLCRIATLWFAVALGGVAVGLLSIGVPQSMRVYANSHYVTPRPTLLQAIKGIKSGFIGGWINSAPRKSCWRPKGSNSARSSTSR